MKGHPQKLHQQLKKISHFAPMMQGHAWRAWLEGLAFVANRGL